MKMKKTKIRAAALCFLAMLLLAPAAAYAKTKAVTYFGDQWPVNFMNGEHARAEEDFARISADGFNTVIYCIPWREMQPDLRAPELDPGKAAKLDELFSKAEKSGLGVMLRLGYTWDFMNTDDVSARYKNVFTDSSVRNAWMKYASDIYALSSAHGNFCGAFITWEDFWPFLSEVYSGYEQMDNNLMKLLTETQTVFPDLSMECRLHNDPTGGTFYSHDATFGCGNASYSSAMLAVSMGWPDGTSIPTEDALAMSSQMIDRMLAAGKPCFIDQFLYMETTPGYERLAAAADTNAYLGGMGNVFASKTCGYGIWTYRDYGNSVIYNPEFGFGKDGWEFSGGTSVEDVNGNRKAKLEANCRITQDISGRSLGGSDKTKVSFEITSDTPGTACIYMGRHTQDVGFEAGTNTVSLEIPNEYRDRFGISADVPVYVDNVRVYSRITAGKIYDINNAPGEYLPGIRALNSKM